MTIAYLCGENSIWKIKDLELLKSALDTEDKYLARIISPLPGKRGRYFIEYILITKEEFEQKQLDGADILLYFREDIQSQVNRLERANLKNL